jgi:hypothetical protein
MPILPFKGLNHYKNRLVVYLAAWIQWWPDWALLNLWVHKLHYWLIWGRIPHNEHACNTLNDWYYWQKSSPRAVIWSYFCDKDLVKDWYALTFGPQYVIPTLLVTDNPKALLAQQFEQACCIKPTHSFGLIDFIPANTPISPQAVGRYAKWLGPGVYAKTREYQYRFLKPKLLVEPTMTYQGGEPWEFKVYLAAEKIVFVKLIVERYRQGIVQMVSEDWTLLEGVSDGAAPSVFTAPVPACWPQVLTISRQVGKLFPFVRVDFMLTDEGLKLGELTFSPNNAYKAYTPATFLNDCAAHVTPEVLSRFI